MTRKDKGETEIISQSQSTMLTKKTLLNVGNGVFLVSKRASLAQAMALDPDILFFDEPLAALDPISTPRLDELNLELRDSPGATVVVVTHEPASIFAIGNNSVFLDMKNRTVTAVGDLDKILVESNDPKFAAS